MTSHITVPQGGSKIVPGQAIPNNPIIPFIEGDGIGIDITPVDDALNAVNAYARAKINTRVHPAQDADEAQAVMRDIAAEGQIGPVLAVWGLGSLIGGLLYGALHRPISAFWLLAGLAAVGFVARRRRAV